MSKKHFIELSDESGLVTVFQIGVDGFAQIQAGLLKELLQDTPSYTFREVGR